MASHSADSYALNDHIQALPPEIQDTILDFTLALKPGRFARIKTWKVWKHSQRASLPDVGDQTVDKVTPPASGSVATASDGPSVDIDPLTMSAIVQVQLEDGQEIVSSYKGKQREGTTNDAQAAMQMYMEDLQNCNTEIEDRKMAQSIALAVQQDGELLHAMFKQEQQIARDHEMALRLSGGARATKNSNKSKQDMSANSQKSDPSDPWQTPELLAKAAAIYMDCSHGPSLCGPSEPSPECGPDDCATAESSAWAASRKENEDKKQVKCVACGEEKAFFDVTRVPCNHEYCRPCLETLFSLSMKDETLFPPRCDGQEIPLRLVRFFLPPELAKAFEGKYEELSTKNRTYCHDRSCESFIPTTSVRNDGANDVATCTKCAKTTCTMCKMATHSGDCPKDEALQQLLATSKKQQWQRCPTCKAIVELRTGCNHITCRCGADFCYVCAAKWHTCKCPVWDERRLLDHQAQIAPHVPNNPRPPQPAIPRRLPDPARVEPPRNEARNEALVQAENRVVAARAAIAVLENRPAQAVDHLHVNHECAHEQWRQKRGRSQCEECQEVLKSYLYECQQCHLQACNRCRRNRLGRT